MNSLVEKRGGSKLKVLEKPELYIAGISCGLLHVRIRWPGLRWNFRKEAACPKERCEQAAVPCFQQALTKTLGASWPRFGGKEEKALGSIQLESDRKERKCGP